MEKVKSKHERTKVAILMLDMINFQKEMLTADKEGHFVIAN